MSVGDFRQSGSVQRTGNLCSKCRCRENRKEARCIHKRGRETGNNICYRRKEKNSKRFCSY